MQRDIILHQMTAMAVAPPELPALAADIGCRQVSLFTFVPAAGLPKANSGFVFPLVTPAMKSAVLDALTTHGISVSGVEFFPIAADIDVADFAPALALGRELGADRAVTLVFDDDPSRALDKLGRLAEMAAAEQLALGLEFTPLTRGCTSLGQAAWFVEQIGAGRLGIGVDALHLVRSGGSAADLLAIDASCFRYAQICDGVSLVPCADYFAETHNRELPGAGNFPLLDILNALPASAALEVEVPSDRRRGAGISDERHAREAIASARAIVDRLTPSR